MNDIEEAKSHLTASFNAENSAASNFERENANTIALIAIAEQLRIRNLIALDAVDATNSSLYDYEDTEIGWMVKDVKPDIAEALGIKKDVNE
jgi:hypothetical protein